MVAHHHEQLLIESGREIGSMWLHRAVTEANDVEQMQNQVFTLGRAALHMLAMIVYNDERLGGQDPEVRLKELTDELRKEFEFAKGCATEGQLNLFAHDNPDGVTH